VVSFFSHSYKYSELTTLEFLSIYLASFMNMLIWQEQNFLMNEIYYSYNYTTFFYYSFNVPFFFLSVFSFPSP
jgi:hypothetical protein